MMPFYYARLRRAREQRHVASLAGDSLCVDATRLWEKELWERFDLRPLLPSLAMPTLVITGEQDFITGPACAAELSDGIPAAETVVLPGTGQHDLRRGAGGVQGGRARVPPRRAARLIEQAVAAPARRAAGGAADRHGLRALRRPPPRDGRAGDLPAQAAPGRATAGAAGEGRRHRSAGLVPSSREPILRAPAARPLHARAAEPQQRFRWLTGSAPETIGVRVPELAGPGRRGARPGRRGGGHERQPPRRVRRRGRSRRFRPRSAPAQPRSSTAASSLARRSTVLDLTGAGAARPARGRGSGSRGSWNAAFGR